MIRKEGKDMDVAGGGAGGGGGYGIQERRETGHHSQMSQRVET